MIDFDKNVIQWANDRDILESSSVKKQLEKLAEEFTELALAVGAMQPYEVADAIGDMSVVMTIIAAKYGFTLSECQERAWNEIKDRKGKMIGGKFVKEL